MSKIDKIAVLIACHNRREKTLACLKALYICSLPKNYSFDIFLVDDASTDGTSFAVKEKYPAVNIIMGNGNLYWNQGMRMAWDSAVETEKYDFYFWLNDDTVLDKKALEEILLCEKEAQTLENKPAILTGACRFSSKTNIFTYGGRTDIGNVIPNGQMQLCKYINGNAVLVPKQIFTAVGNLSPEYTHNLGDIDYGLRVIKAGFKCYTTKSYIAICPTNEGIPAWCNPETQFKKRWRLLYSPKGLNIKEYITFRKKYWGRKWLLFALKAYIKAIFPSFYNKMSKF